MLHHRVVRHDDYFTVSEILVHRKRRDYVDLVADCQTFDVCTQCINDAGRLVAEPRGKPDRFDVDIGTPHRLGAVNTDRLDLDANFVRAGGGDFGLDELENFRAASFCKSDSA